MSDEQRVPIGPWEYFPAQNYDGFAIAPRGRLPTLAAVERKGSITVFNYPDATEAHARLIAAAPDLLALAKKLASECAECRGRGYTFSDDGITGFGPDDREPTREACADCADIREVIAKAEGRS